MAGRQIECSKERLLSFNDPLNSVQPQPSCPEATLVVGCTPQSSGSDSPHLSMGSRRLHAENPRRRPCPRVMCASACYWAGTANGMPAFWVPPGTMTRSRPPQLPRLPTVPRSPSHELAARRPDGQRPLQRQDDADPPRSSGRPGDAWRSSRRQTGRPNRRTQHTDLVVGFEEFPGKRPIDAAPA